MNLDRFQIKALQILKENDGGAVWAKPGTGKTRIALAYFKHLSRYIERNIYIVITRRRAFDDWIREMRKVHLTSPDWTTQVIDKLEDTLTVLPARNVVWLVSHGMIAKLAIELRIASRLDMRAVCIDEAFLFKNPSAVRSQSAQDLCRAVPKSFLLSGTIMTARNLEDVFGQLFAIDQHQALADTLTKFRSKFMRRYAIGQWHKWFAPKEETQRVANLVQPFSISHFPKDSIRSRHIIKECELGHEQSHILHSLQKEYWADLSLHGGGEMEISNAVSLIIKTQQISNGWLQLARPDDQTPIEFPSPKIELLFNIIEEIIESGNRCVVWCAFNQDVRILRDLFKAQPTFRAFTCCTMSGRYKFDPVHWADPRTHVCFATVASGMSVNHFEQVPYAIYFSMDMKWLHLQQSRMRHIRKGSKHLTATFYYLFSKGSLDRFVYQTARTSGKKETELINLIRIRKWLKSARRRLSPPNP